jgi:beta-fructofuranosidase
VFWEHLPIALCPSTELEEEHCFSGDAVITEAGVPTILYTSTPSMEQWAAIGDDDLIVWSKHPDNPVLPRTLHSDLVEIGSWRDPFVLRHEGRTYVLTGGYVGEKRGPGTSHGHVSLYRAENPELTQWTYLGPLFVAPVSHDCAMPTLFPVGDRWALIVSRHNPHVVDYYVGTLDLEAVAFHPETHAPFEHGEGVYANHGLEDPSGRLIVWGTIHSYRSDRGWIDWPGCQTLPRLVTLRPDGLLGFEPLPELQVLRGRHSVVPELSLDSTAHILPQVRGDLLEFIAEFEPGDAAAFGLKVRRSDDGNRAVTIRYDGGRLEVDGERGLFNEQEGLGPFELQADEQTLRLHVFLDKGVIEVYANRRACYSRPIDAGPEDLGVEAFAEGGLATLRSLDAWEMKPIW